MYISFKKIIHGMDKLIHPKKYYTNNITKNIKNLEKGDTVYVMRIPNMEHMSISMSFSALEEIIMKKCTVDHINAQEEFKSIIIELRVYVKNSSYKLTNGLNYYGVGENGRPTRDCIIRFFFNAKGVHNSFIVKTPYGKVLVTTDKNAIIRHINQMANVIKDRLYERLKEQEKYPYNYDCDYPIATLRNFKKQYASLRNQVRML